MFIVSLSFGKEQVVGDILEDVEIYLKSVIEHYIKLYSYDFFDKGTNYELCFYTDSDVTLNIIDFIKSKFRVSGLVGKLEVYENRLVYGGLIYGKRK